MISQYKHYLAIANDPPDPDFAHPTTLEPLPAPDAAPADPVLAGLTRYRSAADAESATALAFLHAIERYQGATAAHDAGWALAQARQALNLARTLHAQALQSKAALAAVDTAAMANEDGDAAAAQSMANKVAASGFDGTQVRALRNLGFTDADIVDAESFLIGQSGQGVSAAEVTEAKQSLLASYDDGVAGLATTAAGLAAVVSALAAQSAVPQDLPVADAGGPYTATAGSPLTLDGVASTGATSYAWDLDGDGQFDDATGSAPSVVLPAGTPGPIGLKVTGQGGTAVSYAPVTVTEGAPAPAITATPAGQVLRVTVGAPTGFAVAGAADVRWSVDGTPAGSGPSFSFTADAPGIRQVEAAASSDTGGPSVARRWLLAATAADADSDGWSATSDCNDSDAGVHPSRSELFRNGIDDDCDSGTPDVPAGGVPSRVLQWGWGTTHLGDLVDADKHVLDDVVQVAGGYRAAALVDDQGHVATWSTPLDTSFSGDGTYTSYSTPRRVASVGATKTDADHQLTGVTQVAVNDVSYVARRADGSVVAWGQNTAGEVGDGTQTSRLTPVVVKGIGGIGHLSHVRYVTTGGDVSLAVLDDGTAVGWGQRAHMCLGNDATKVPNVGPQLTPMPLPQWGTGLTKMVVNSAGTIGLYADGSVKACGSPTEGISGRQNIQWPEHTLPNAVDNLSSGVIDIAIHDHAIALKSDGSVWVWGRNQVGQIGIGTTTPYLLTYPQQVPLPAGPKVVAISAGYDTDVAVRADGSALTWGHNSGGVAATGSPDAVLMSPTPLTLPAGRGLSTSAGGVMHDGLAIDLANPNPSAPSRSVGIGSTTVAEGAGLAGLTVTLSAPRREDTTVHVRTAAGTADAADFTPVDADVTVVAGETTAVVAVPVTDDALVEGTESFSVAVTDVPGGIDVTDGVGTVSITDDDIASAGSEVSVADVRVPEHDAAAVTFSLASPAAEPVAISYATTDGTADSADYTPAKGTVTIPAGATSATTEVAVTDDSAVEPDETFDVVVTGVVNAHGTPTGHVTVLDDDAYQLQSTAAAGREADGHVAVQLTVSPAPVSPITLDVTTKDGTAKAGEDYTAMATNLTFDATHATRTVSVPLVDDAVQEDTESLDLVLSGVDAGRRQLLGVRVVHAGIVDDDAPVRMATTVAYTGPTTVQYSDPAVLRGRLQAAGSGVVGEQLVVGLGSLTRTVGPTDSTGSSAAAAATVLDTPGPTTASAAYAGSATYDAAQVTVPATIAREDCLLSYTGDTLSSAAGSTTLRAALTEPDSTPGDHAGKALTFTLTDGAGVKQVRTATTDSGGVASSSVALAAGAYDIDVAFAGDAFYEPCAAATASVLAVTDVAAKATGGGWTTMASGRVSFGLNVKQDVTGLHGQLQLTARNGKDRFHAGIVTTLSGTRTSATWTGTGTWNGTAGCTFTASVTDGGKADTIAVTVRSGSTTLLSTGTQSLRGGNLTVH